MSPDNPNRHNRHSFIMVETDRKGYEANKLKGKLGVRASDTSEISFSDLRVPVTNLLGQEGNGFKQLMKFFDLTRIFVSAQAIGVARSALEEAVTHIKKRRQFGQTLSSFQINQFKVAEMATRIKAARNLIYEAACDRGQVSSILGKKSIIADFFENRNIIFWKIR